MVISMAVVFRFSPMEIDTRVYMQMESQRAMERIAGKMGLFIKGSSKMASDMDTDAGSSESKATRVITSMIKETVKEYTSGEAAVTTKDNF